MIGSRLMSRFFCIAAICLALSATGGMASFLVAVILIGGGIAVYFTLKISRVFLSWFFRPWSRTPEVEQQVEQQPKKKTHLEKLQEVKKDHMAMLELLEEFPMSEEDKEDLRTDLQETLYEKLYRLIGAKK